MLAWTGSKEECGLLVSDFYFNSIWKYWVIEPLQGEKVDPGITLRPNPWGGMYEALKMILSHDSKVEGILFQVWPSNFLFKIGTILTGEVYKLTKMQVTVRPYQQTQETANVCP